MNPRLWLGRILLIAAIGMGMALDATAQSEDEGEDMPDSTQGVDLNELAAMARAMADSAAADSLHTGFDWIGPTTREIRGDVQSNVSSVRKTGRLSLSGLVLDGAILNTMYEKENTSFRQQDRNTDRTSVDGSLERNLGGGAHLSLRVMDNSTEDVNRLQTGDIVVYNAETRGSLALDGAGQVGERHRHAWGVRGDVLDVSGTNRGTNNDRSLLSSAFSGRWNYEHEIFTLQGRGGYDRATGDRQLRGQSDDAKTVQDTLGTSLEIDRGRWFNLTSSVDRITFREDRLDFRRSSSGVIDTLGYEEDEIVGQEHEVQNTRRVKVAARTRPFRLVGLSTNFGHDFTETEFDFSQQGLLQKGGDRWNLDMDFRYAAAGSLTVGYRWEEVWNDRRTREDDQFRGRERRVNKEVSLGIKQGLFAHTDLDVGMSQRLNQNIYEEKTNKNDRDQLYERFDAKIQSNALPHVRLRVGATYNRTDQVNVAAERVGNNKEDRLFEVRGGYTWDATESVSFEQTYRMQIVYVDYHNSNDRDQFNKQGQLLNSLRLKLPSGASLDTRYTVDFRRNGKRDEDNLESTTYITDLRRFDHQIRATVMVPVRFLTLSVDSQRGYLRDENPSAGSERKEDRGEIHFRVEGEKKFRKNMVELRLNVERVLAFGPRVREENEDYWVANSGLTVRF